VPLILRAIQKGRWRTAVDAPELGWLPPGEVQAQALRDLEPANNRLSVWHVEDDRSNLDRLLAVLASTRDALFSLDYALLDEAHLARLGIRTEGNPGESPDREANLQWHRELVELSVSKIASLSSAILEHGERSRRMDRSIATLLLQSVAAGHLDPAQFKEGLRSRLDRFAEGRQG
jgi:hypothetical protein